MSSQSTEINKIGRELHEAAQEYAKKAAALAGDPYFKEAIVKVSVSGFVWALYHVFEDDFARRALDHELKVQSAAVERALGSKGTH